METVIITSQALSSRMSTATAWCQEIWLIIETPHTLVGRQNRIGIISNIREVQPHPNRKTRWEVHLATNSDRWQEQGTARLSITDTSHKPMAFSLRHHLTAAVWERL